MWIEISIFLGVVWLLHWIQWRGFLSSVRHPPSFYGLPLVGVLPWMLLYDDQLGYLRSLVKKHGPVLRFRMGLSDVVIANGIDGVKEVFKNEDLLGRPRLQLFEFLQSLFNARPFVVMSGDSWRSVRNNSVHAMRELGFGKTPKMEGHIQNEISYYMDELSKNSGREINPKSSLLASVSNNIATLIFGDRLPYDHPKRKDLNEFLCDLLDAAGVLVALNFVPYLVEILGFLKIKLITNLKEKAHLTDKIFRSEKESHRKNYDDQDRADFMDHMIAAQDEKKDLFTDGIVHGTSIAFFVAGSNTTRVTLELLFQLCAKYPQLQEQLYKEIIDEIGPSRTPQWSDREKLNYVNAFIEERHRLSTVAPVGLFRQALRDTKLCGYDVQRGITVVYNVDSAHKDTSVFDKPEEFLPERFLDSNGNFTPPKTVVAFASGKRACPGESMAVFEVFLYFTSVVQRFRIEPPVNGEIKIKIPTKVTSEPIPQNLRFIKRE